MESHYCPSTHTTPIFEKNSNGLVTKLVKTGDTLKLCMSIVENGKERMQYVEGIVICKKNSGVNTTITLRRILQGVGVERVYFLHSPTIQSIEILRSSKTRRSKLYYLRTRSGKAARLHQL
uniref:Ribosomal protein L19 n=1 Tax=Cryptomonas sp. CCAC 1634B TaxID=2051848 RepID=A0A679C9U9_9CRYP|nr:ribosomal protein L19 [Cryptomonas sp. CCAC 1634B]